MIWQKAMALVTELYLVTKNFPKDEVYGLTSQIRRCAISIASNIAEGYGRHTDSELIRYLNISKGSLFELQTQLEIAFNIKYLQKSKFNELYENTREIEIMIVSFSNKLKQRN